MRQTDHNAAPCGCFSYHEDKQDLELLFIYKTSVNASFWLFASKMCQRKKQRNKDEVQTEHEGLVQQNVDVRSIKGEALSAVCVCVFLHRGQHSCKR